MDQVWGIRPFLSCANCDSCFVHLNVIAVGICCVFPPLLLFYSQCFFPYKQSPRQLKAYSIKQCFLEQAVVIFKPINIHLKLVKSEVTQLSSIRGVSSRPRNSVVNILCAVPWLQFDDSASSEASGNCSIFRWTSFRLPVTMAGGYLWNVCSIREQCHTESHVWSGFCERLKNEDHFSTKLWTTSKVTNYWLTPGDSHEGTMPQQQPSVRHLFGRKPRVVPSIKQSYLKNHSFVYFYRQW